MVIYRLNPTSSVLLSFSLGTSNSTAGISVKRAHIHMGAPNRLAFLIKVGPSLVYAANIQSKRRCRDPPNFIAYFGVAYFI